MAIGQEIRSNICPFSSNIRAVIINSDRDSLTITTVT